MQVSKALTNILYPSMFVSGKQEPSSRVRSMTDVWRSTLARTPACTTLAPKILCASKKVSMNEMDA